MKVDLAFVRAALQARNDGIPAYAISAYAISDASGGWLYDPRRADQCRRRFISDHGRREK